MTATVEQRNAFINEMIDFAAPVAVAQNLPAAALVACGAIESGYGISTIYGKTHCPFNLQKPDHYKWVHCSVVWLTTLSKMDASGKQSGVVRAPFCKADGATAQEWLADAARIWCEWVLGWPQDGNRNVMLSLRTKPLEFAKSLHRLGFGDPKVATLTAQTYENVFKEQRLIERCAKAGRPSMPVPQWLPGWWRVTWRGQIYYYHFDKLYRVVWTSIPPLNLSFFPVGTRDQGTVSISAGSDLEIVWGSTGSVEKFTSQSVAASQTMDGTWNGSERLQAQRLA
jgi:hypothetical protein